MVGAPALVLADRLGQRLLARDAETALCTDERCPILYLRNFGDDKMRLRAGRFSRRGLLGRISPWRTRSFEEVVFSRLGSLGPVIAANPPGKRLPALGTAKMTLPLDGWKDEIRKLARQSWAVVVSATPAQINDGLREELKMITQEIGHRRVIYLLGTGRKGDIVNGRWRKKDFRSRWYCMNL